MKLTFCKNLKIKLIGWVITFCRRALILTGDARGVDGKRAKWARWMGSVWARSDDFAKIVILKLQMENLVSVDSEDSVSPGCSFEEGTKRRVRDDLASALSHEKEEEEEKIKASKRRRPPRFP